MALAAACAIFCGASPLLAVEPPPLPGKPMQPPVITQPIAPKHTVGYQPSIRPVVQQTEPTASPASLGTLGGPLGVSMKKPSEYQAIFEIPNAERLFRLESEAEFIERVKKEYKVAHPDGKAPKFPAEPELVPPGTTYAGRVWPTQFTVRNASFVCYNPLYFEDKNSERYHWDAGIFQPFLSVGKFYCDFIKWPYMIGLQCPCDCEYNTGYCLPGDPVSYYLYYPQWSWKAAAFQTGAVLGLIAVLP